MPQYIVVLMYIIGTKVMMPSLWNEVYEKGDTLTEIRVSHPRTLTVLVHGSRFCFFCAFFSGCTYTVHQVCLRVCALCLKLGCVWHSFCSSSWHSSDCVALLRPRSLDCDE